MYYVYIYFLYFTPETVKKKLNKLKPFPAPGPDGFTSSLLIKLSDKLCNPLSLIFNMSMNEGKVPPGKEMS